MVTVVALLWNPMYGAAKLTTFPGVLLQEKHLLFLKFILSQAFWEGKARIDGHLGIMYCIIYYYWLRIGTGGELLCIRFEPSGSLKCWETIECPSI
jgi:hypothetical protein